MSPQTQWQLSFRISKQLVDYFRSLCLYNKIKFLNGIKLDKKDQVIKFKKFPETEI